MQYAPGWTAYFLPIRRIWQGLRFRDSEPGKAAETWHFLVGLCGPGSGIPARHFAELL
jgi:hypothetical protein